MPLNKEMSVLIVDDYQTMRGVIRNLFNQLGFFNVSEAATTHEALSVLEQQPCGLVIFDWQTGPMTGEDFLKTMRNNPKLKDTAFVVVSAQSNDDLTDIMKNAGAADFIAKPFTKATLKKRMTALFGSF